MTERPPGVFILARQPQRRARFNFEGLYVGFICASCLSCEKFVNKVYVLKRFCKICQIEFLHLLYFFVYIPKMQATYRFKFYIIRKNIQIKNAEKRADVISTNAPAAACF